MGVLRSARLYALKLPALFDLFCPHPDLSPDDQCPRRQGRYFVIALPVAAIFVAAVINRELPEGMPAAIATAGSMIAGLATVEALLQAHW
jgi:hypothetical protein